MTILCVMQILWRLEWGARAQTNGIRARWGRGYLWWAWETSKTNRMDIAMSS